MSVNQYQSQEINIQFSIFFNLSVIFILDYNVTLLGNFTFRISNVPFFHFKFKSFFKNNKQLLEIMTHSEGCVHVRSKLFLQGYLTRNRKTLPPQIKWAAGIVTLIWSCWFSRQTNCSDIWLSPVLHDFLLLLLING